MTQPTNKAEQANNVKKAFEFIVAHIKQAKILAAEGIADLGRKLTVLGERMNVVESNISTLYQTNENIIDFLGTIDGEKLAEILAVLEQE